MFCTPLPDSSHGALPCRRILVIFHPVDERLPFGKFANPPEERWTLLLSFAFLDCLRELSVCHLGIAFHCVHLSLIGSTSKVWIRILPAWDCFKTSGLSFTSAYSVLTSDVLVFTHAPCGHCKGIFTCLLLCTLCSVLLITVHRDFPV